MTRSNTLCQELLRCFRIAEDISEKKEIIYRLVEHRTGLTKSEIMAGKETPLRVSDFENELARLNQYEPIQYVTGFAWFYGRKFSVNPQVLIPRPETEEIIDLVKKFAPRSPAMLDVGTGSGCLAVSLALEFPEACVSALDISAGALDVARENARLLHANVNFFLMDALHRMPTGEFDFIVSNPPYIAPQDMEKLSPTVRFEPALALTPGNHNFYRRLSEWRHLLKPSGKMVLEFVPNEVLSEESLKKIFYEKEFSKVEAVRSGISNAGFVVGWR